MPADAPAPKRSPGRPKDAQLQARRTEEILTAAARLFAQLGYAHTDTQALADELQVGKGTLYRYFASKEQLFLDVVDNAMQRLSTTVVAARNSQSDALDKISAAVRAYLAFFEENPECVELLIQERAHFKDRKKPTYFVHREKQLGPWHDLLRELIDDGRVRDIPVNRITDVFSDLMYGTIFTNYFTGRKKSLAAQAEDILDIIFRGILTDRERNSEE